MSEFPSIAIVGPGAIGTTIAAALNEKGHTPILCGRTRKDSLLLRSDEGEIKIPGPVLVDPTQIGSPVDLVFVAVKTTQNQSALQWLTTLCNEKTVVCVLQNGVEQKAAFAPYVPGIVMPAVVWFPAQRQPDGSVWLRAHARITVPKTEGSETVLEALNGTLCKAETAEDFITMAWSKLMRNSAAGLMVLTGRRAGMFKREDVAKLTEAYLEESLLVALAEGARLSKQDPQIIVGQMQSWPDDMGTSILADREKGQPLEWDIRNGVIQRYGKLHNIPTPISDVVVPLLAAASEGPG